MSAGAAFAGSGAGSAGGQTGDGRLVPPRIGRHRRLDDIGRGVRVTLQGPARACGRAAERLGQRLRYRRGDGQDGGGDRRSPRGMNPLTSAGRPKVDTVAWSTGGRHTGRGRITGRSGRRGGAVSFTGTGYVKTLAGLSGSA